MSKIKFALIPLLLATLLSSCMGDSEEEKVYSDDCAITDMVLGTLKRTITVKRANGKDTTYVTTIYGGRYPMYIDQFKREIYNPDSLPVGTKITSIIFSSVTSDGTLAYRTASGSDTLFKATDSLDFTNPRIFTCYSYSGKGKRTYTVRVNVHKLAPEVFTWSKVSENTILSGVSAQKLIVYKKKLYDFVDEGGTMALLSSDNGSDWEKRVLTGNSPTHPNSIQLVGEEFFGWRDANVVHSSDGVNWETQSTTNLPSAVSALLGSGAGYLFARVGDDVYSSTDGAKWQKDELDASADNLPVSDFCSAWSEMNFNSDFVNLFLTGNNLAGESVLWKKVVDLTNENSDVWSYYPKTNEITYPFPQLKNGVMLNYDKKLLYSGCLNDTVSLFYMSEDAGRNWRPQTNGYIHPTIGATNFGCAVDDDNFIWFLCGGTGEIWKGRLNRLSFITNQTTFTE